MVMDLRYGPPRECALCRNVIAVTAVDPSIAGIEAFIGRGASQFWFCHAACFKQRVVGPVAPHHIPPVPDRPMDRRYGPNGELRVCGFCNNRIEVIGRDPAVIGVAMLDGTFDGWFCHSDCFRERINNVVAPEQAWTDA